MCVDQELGHSPHPLLKVIAFILFVCWRCCRVGPGAQTAPAVENLPGPSAGVTAMIDVRRDTAQERVAALKARRSELKRQQRAVFAEIRNATKRRARLASRLRGFADDDVPVSYTHLTLPTKA